MKESCKDQGNDNDDSSFDIYVVPASDLPNWVGRQLGRFETAPHTNIQAWVRNGVAVRVQILCQQTDDYRSALVQKYGEPKTRKVEFQNKYGKSWTADALEWQLPGLHVEFSLDNIQEDQGRSGITTLELQTNANLRRQNEATQKASKRKL
jgi:hypothetical protein